MTESSRCQKQCSLLGCESQIHPFGRGVWKREGGEEGRAAPAARTTTKPILPTASLWSLSTWQTSALHRCTAMRWIDSSCLVGLRMLSRSSLTRRYWNSSSSGMLKLQSVRQQFRWTWVRPGDKWSTVRGGPGSWTRESL